MIARQSQGQRMHTFSCLSSISMTRGGSSPGNSSRKWSTRSAPAMTTNCTNMYELGPTHQTPWNQSTQQFKKKKKKKKPHTHKIGLVKMQERALLTSYTTISAFLFYFLFFLQLKPIRLQIATLCDNNHTEPRNETDHWHVLLHPWHVHFFRPRSWHRLGTCVFVCSFRLLSTPFAPLNWTGERTLRKPKCPHLTCNQFLTTNQMGQKA